MLSESLMWEVKVGGKLTAGRGRGDVAGERVVMVWPIEEGDDSMNWHGHYTRFGSVHYTVDSNPRCADSKAIRGYKFHNQFPGSGKNIYPVERLEFSVAEGDPYGERFRRLNDKTRHPTEVETGLSSREVGRKYRSLLEKERVGEINRYIAEGWRVLENCKEFERVVEDGR